MEERKMKDLTDEEFAEQEVIVRQNIGIYLVAKERHNYEKAQKVKDRIEKECRGSIYDLALAVIAQKIIRMKEWEKGIEINWVFRDILKEGHNIKEKK